MFIQTIWKRLTNNDAPLSMAISLLRPLPFRAKPYFKQPNFCTQIAAPFTTPDRGIATEFLIKNCGLTDEDITKAFRHCNELLRAKSTENLEQVLEMLNGCGLTAPEQIRKVVLWNPKFFFLKSERNLKAKLSILRTFMKEEDIFKLLYRDTQIFTSSERTLKSTISLLQKMDIEGDALSYLVARAPRLLVTSEERVMESLKLADGFGFKKGSKLFAIAVTAIFGSGKEKVDRKLRCLSSLGFSEKQISDLIKKRPTILILSEEKMKRNVDFMVQTLGFPLVDFLKYSDLFGYSLETKVIPRYRVLEALKSMQVRVWKRVSKRGRCIPKIMKLTEKNFLEKYVNFNVEYSPVLQDIYHGRKAGKLIIDKDRGSERVSLKEIHESRES